MFFKLPYVNLIFLKKVQFTLDCKLKIFWWRIWILFKLLSKTELQRSLNCEQRHFPFQNEHSIHQNDNCISLWTRAWDEFVFLIEWSLTWVDRHPLLSIRFYYLCALLISPVLNQVYWCVWRIRPRSATDRSHSTRSHRCRWLNFMYQSFMPTHQHLPFLRLLFVLALTAI